MSLGLGRWWGQLILVMACCACSTVQVHVLPEEGRVGTYCLLFLTVDQKSQFDLLKEEHSQVSDWLNPGSDRGTGIGQLIADLGGRCRTGSIDEGLPLAFNVRGRDGVAGCSYIVLVAGSPGELQQDKNFLLVRRKTLLHWPYWSDAYITVSPESLRIGKPAPREEGGTKP